MNLARACLVLFLIVAMTGGETIIAVIGTNDIHGRAFPTVLSREDTGEKYNYGGLVYLARLIQIIKSEHPDATLFLDAGDQYQGGIEASRLISSGQIMTDFYNMCGLHSSSLGNHEFDFGPEFLFSYLENMESPVLAANLRFQAEGTLTKKHRTSEIFEFRNGIKIGVIGLSTVETPKTTSAFSTGKFPRYVFLDYKEVVIAESRKLRAAGANAVLIVSHIGDSCPSHFEYGNWTQNSVVESCSEDEMTLLLRSLPKGTVDGVIQGHRHQIVHHYIEGVPNIGSIDGGYYFNVLYLTFNDAKILIDTKIEGPIPVCEKVFENNGRCGYVEGEELEDAGKLVNWTFHNQPIYAHEGLSSMYNAKWMPLMQPYLEEIVKNQVELKSLEDAESPLANLFTNLMHLLLPRADFVLVNPGGFRTEWQPGVIQYQHFYNMFPFDNSLCSFEISGSELWETLRIIQSGDKGFYQAWNLKMHVTLEDGVKGFVSAGFMDGRLIQADATYTGITVDFLLQGGDDFSRVIDTVYFPRNVQVIGELKSTLKPLLKQVGVIREEDLLDPANPRLIIN